MRREEVRRRLRENSYWVPRHLFARVVSYALGDSPRSAGHPGHRTYTEWEYRLILSWLRVNDLVGVDSTTHLLVREAANRLAANTHGYVWISGGRVQWSPDPPVAAIRSGVNTCWKVWE